MIRVLFTLSLFCFTGLAVADPVKKAPPVDSDKLAKECADAFVKAILAGDGEAAIQCCTTPFLGPQGKKSDTLDDLKKEFGRPPPKGLTVKVGEIVALDKLNAGLKKAGLKEMGEDILKSYGEYLDKDGRIVMLEITQDCKPLPKEDPPHMLVRVKDGKAKIVGVGGR